MPSIPGRAPCTSHEIRIPVQGQFMNEKPAQDRKSTRLNSSHSQISYAVFCLKKKKDYKFYIVGQNSRHTGTLSDMVIFTGTRLHFIYSCGRHCYYQD